MAEGEGFEPSKGLLLYTRSRRASSTTPAPFRATYYYTKSATYILGQTALQSLRTKPPSSAAATALPLMVAYPLAAFYNGC